MDEERVRGLLRDQFPQWADLSLTEWHEQGTDHTLFRLGDHMVVRMPIRPFNNAPLEKQQVGREARWVPFLAPQLPLEMPEHLGLGVPTDDYPWHWSIVSWIPGERATRDAAHPRRDRSRERELRHRTFACRVGRGSCRGRVGSTGGVVPRRPRWQLDRGRWPPRRGHRLAIWRRRPACDVTPGWSMFTGAARQRFFDEVGLDEATKQRARGWVLGPASFGLTYYAKVPSMLQNQIDAIEHALSD